MGGVSLKNLVHLAEQNKRHGRLPLVDAIMSIRLASNYSPHWPIYGLKNNCTDFTIDRLNPYATTPPQAIRAIPIPHQLRLARQNQLHRCVPFVEAATWVCFVLWFSVYSWFYCPKVECYAFSWNQLVICVPGIIYYVVMLGRRGFWNWCIVILQYRWS